MTQRPATLDYRYLSTPTGQLNIAEIICLIGALISVAFTSRLYCELVDNLQWVYPELSTLLVRSLFQSFAILCLIVTLVILLVHIYGLRYSGKHFVYFNQLCLILNVIMGLMMISIGVCAALWEDKLRRTPAIVRRGYYSNKYQYVFGELTHARPGAAAAAAIFALLAGVLLIIEACTRPMLNAGVSTQALNRPRTVAVATKQNPLNSSSRGERVIPIETTIASYSQARV